MLNQIVSFLTAHPTYTLTLYGFTDQQANEQYNLKLSLRRAQAVSQYLTQQGVALNRIATEAKGKTQLIENENLKMGRALSRRVELVYVDPEGREIQTIRQNQDIQLER